MRKVTQRPTLEDGGSETAGGGADPPAFFFCKKLDGKCLSIFAVFKIRILKTKLTVFDFWLFLYTFGYCFLSGEI